MQGVETATVPLSLVISFASSAMMVVMGVVMALSRYAFTVKEKELERQVGEAAKVAQDAAHSLGTEKERFHERELRVTRLEGELNLVKATTDSLGDTVRDIKDTMVPRHEWQAHAQRTDRQLETILNELRRPPGRYSSGAMPATSPPPPVPRPSRPRADDER